MFKLNVTDKFVQVTRNCKRFSCRWTLGWWCSSFCQGAFCLFLYFCSPLTGNTSSGFGKCELLKCGRAFNPWRPRPVATWRVLNQYLLSLGFATFWRETVGALNQGWQSNAQNSLRIKRPRRKFRKRRANRYFGQASLIIINFQQNWLNILHETKRRRPLHKAWPKNMFQGRTSQTITTFTTNRFSWLNVNILKLLIALTRMRQLEPFVPEP